MSSEIHTSAFADETLPLKQVFRKFGWLAFDFCFFKEMSSLLESIGCLFGGGSLCVSAALAYRTLKTYAILLSKCILCLFLTSYTNLLCERMTPGHFLLLSWPFLLSKDVESPLSHSFCAHPVHRSWVFVFDDLLINRKCLVSLCNLDPQLKHQKGK